MRAPAKINLFLHMLGKREDGYHLLESLVAFASVHDTVSVAPSDHISLTVTGPFASQLAGENIILKAAMLLNEKSGMTKGAAITLEKHLPVASGIGGGSSDAAAVLRLLNDYWQCGISETVMLQLAATLGSDVPCCYLAQTAMITHIGEQVTPVAGLPELAAILVNPLLPLSTPAVYKQGVVHYSPSILPLPGAIDIEFLERQHNDLEAPAMHLMPLIGDILGLIAAQGGCRFSRMSGSGATCFGLFDRMEQAEIASHIIAASQPGWWVRPCWLGKMKE